MINKPTDFKRLNIRIPTIIPIKGRGLLIRGLGYLHHRTGLFIYAKLLPRGPWLESEIAQTKTAYCRVPQCDGLNVEVPQNSNNAADKFLEG